MIYSRAAVLQRGRIPVLNIDMIFTVRNRSFGKVMFSQASVSHSVRSGLVGYPWSHVLSEGVDISGPRSLPGGGYVQGDV